MSELKPCPFCGGNDVVYEEALSVTYCDDCGGELDEGFGSTWNTRPIEDALNKRIAELEKENFRLKEANEDAQSRLDDYRKDVSRVLDEKCPTDERHCGCVPILRFQLNKYQKALILITTMPLLSQVKQIAIEALQERGKYIWSEQSVGEYWVNKLDILQDKFDTLEKDYADVCQRRLSAADVFSRQIIELESKNAELEAAQRWIPVSERLPEEKQNVLALDKTGTAYHWEYSRSLSNIFVSFYTHWMPLPKLPEVQE